MYKTLSDLERVIKLGKAQHVIDSFALSYKTGVAMQPFFDAEGEYLKLVNAPDIKNRPALVDQGTLEIVLEEINYNQIRDDRITELEVQHPYLIEPEQTYHEVTKTNLDGDTTTYPVADRMPTLEQRRPEVVVDATGFAETLFVDELRRAVYPDIGDQLDAIWKQLNTDRFNGHGMIQQVDDMLGDILAVKAKFPKD